MNNTSDRLYHFKFLVCKITTEIKLGSSTRHVLIDVKPIVHTAHVDYNKYQATISYAERRTEIGLRLGAPRLSVSEVTSLCVFTEVTILCY
jgi:hypothetical protein